MPRTAISATVVAAAILVAGIGAGAAYFTLGSGLAAGSSTSQTSSSVSHWSALFGSWTAYSTAFYYDAGGGGTGNILTNTLAINPDGTWSYGNSRGTWSVGNISSPDWVRWHNSPQSDMAYKIMLKGWNANGTTGIGDGPIQFSSTPGQVDFVWILYHVGPPTVPDAGEVYLKFGHSNLSG